MIREIPENYHRLFDSPQMGNIFNVVNLEKKTGSIQKIEISIGELL